MRTCLCAFALKDAVDFTGQRKVIFTLVRFFLTGSWGGWGRGCRRLPRRRMCEGRVRPLERAANSCSAHEYLGSALKVYARLPCHRHNFHLFSNIGDRNPPLPKPNPHNGHIRQKVEV